MKLTHAQRKHRHEMKRTNHRKGLRIHAADERKHQRRELHKRIAEAMAKAEAEKKETKV